ncbi:unnamed protein product [Vicia faba]|uniref:Uncharacterized protein n=1 Tax=Vicia faba TaxID=3906 RepID=A0AAV0Z1P8_VICFA|nr:unnamed protein product [Vicia faba]
MLEEEGSANDKGGRSSGKGNSSGSGLHNLSGDALTEFRQSIKKVELPSFNGEDPAGWISRAEVYFRVQETLPELKAEIRGRVRSFVAMGEMSRARLLQVTRAVEKEVYGEKGSSSSKGPRSGSGSREFGLGFSEE